ncbi:MAG: hypothetical protein Q9N62_02090 [Ghiorsea sp.]|nr:hypothetical protein [Ghiorsea sp.]
MNDMKKSLPRSFDVREVGFLFIIFLSAFFLLFINDGVFWDTWVLYNQPLSVLVDTFTQAGAPWAGYYHYFVISSFGIWGAKFIMGSAYFLSGVFLNEIVRKLGCIKLYDRLLIVVLFLIAPVNFARISTINHPSAVCMLSFFIGLYLFLAQLNMKSYAGLTFRILALFAFYFSFMLNSVLVLYAIVPMLFMCWFHLQGFSALASAKEGLKYIDFWVLPIVFYVVKTVFFTPSGLYEGYNALTVQAVVL